MQSTRVRQCVILLFVFVTAGLGFSQSAFASESLRGVITALNTDGTVNVRTDDASNITVVLSDTTKIRRTDGMRVLKVSSSALIPGLRVRAVGEYQTGSRFVAD